MNDIDCSYDDLLCRSLSLFRQFRLYDDRIEAVSYTHLTLPTN